ncbi:MAG: hypothetical protein L3J22_09940 [Xanthomonadales bacterium]|nr:hypothetical protein [Xanthomonadales bacterium]
MNKPWQTIRFFMALAILLTSFQSVMAMPASQNLVLSVDHSMMQMPMETQTETSIGATNQVEISCESDCCEGSSCKDGCEAMDGNCGNCIHLSSLLLPSFLMSFSSPSAIFLIANRQLPDLPPPPPTKPPV